MSVAKCLSQMGRKVLDALIEGPTACRSPDDLARQLGWEPEATLDEVAGLDAQGWLDAWDLAEGPVVTLSAMASARLGVRLVEVGPRETPRWARESHPDPPSVRSAGLFRTDRAAKLDLVVDPNPSCETRLIDGETAEQERHGLVADGNRPAEGGPNRPDPRDWPRPTLIVGERLTPWPGPGPVDLAACPGCGSRSLARTAYCLLCDRWGCDDLLEAIRATNPGPRPRPRPPVAPEPRKPDPSREKRRIRRKQRLESLRAASRSRRGPAPVAPCNFVGA